MKLNAFGRNVWAPAGLSPNAIAIHTGAQCVYSTNTRSGLLGLEYPIVEHL